MSTTEALALVPKLVRKESYRDRVRDFFFAQEVPYGMAAARILITFTVLFVMVPRWFFARELFSTDGAPITLYDAYASHPLIPNPNGVMAVAIASVVVLCLVTSLLGWCTRVSLILASSGFLYLNMLDIIGTMNKYTAIALHIMLLLCFSECGAVWSIDSWLRRSRLRRQGVLPELADQPPRSSAVARRLLQVFIAIVYFGAATTKLRIPAYFTGMQLQTWMITEYNVPNFLGHRFAMYPSLLAVFADVAVCWEILFMFLAWRGLGRTIMIGLGVVFHLMTWLTLGLWVFPPVCFAAYFAFLNENDVEWMRSVLARWRARGRGLRAKLGRLLQGPALGTLPFIRPSWCYGTFTALALVTGVGGVGLEHSLDPYGIRRPEGPYTLKEMDPKLVIEMLAPTGRIRNEDKVLLFDVGSVMVGGAVFDRRTQFRQGETVRIECDLNPPHEDMWIECNLHDSENRVVDTIGIFVACDEMRPMFFYSLGDCTMPGKYELVLRIGGEELMRRPINILPRNGTACLAN